MVLAVGERAAERGLYAEDVEVVCRHARAAQAHGFVDAGERDRAASLSGNEFEDGVFARPVEVVERRDAVGAAARRLLEHAHDAPGFGVEQGPEQDGVDEAEDRGVRADADGERGQRDRGEAALPHECARAEFQILEEVVHGACGNGKSASESCQEFLFRNLPGPKKLPSQKTGACHG